MAGILAAAIPAVIGGLAGGYGQHKANRTNIQLAREQMGFQREMRSTQWQAAVEDMRRAGINPALAYSQGPAASPGGASAQVGNVAESGISSAQQAAVAQQTLRLLEHQVKEAEGKADSAAAQGEIDQWRKSALINVKMDWDGDGVSEQLIMDMLRNEWLQGRYSMRQTRNISRLSQLGGDTAAAFSPALRSFTGMAGRGWKTVAGGFEALERLTGDQLRDIFKRALRRDHPRFNRR